MELQKRVEWIDNFKALAIILVVIGHATPLFNKYIYQFHVAAFFFIAGYVSNIVAKRVDELLINKVLTLLMPYTFFACVGVTAIWICNKAQVLPYVSTITEVPGVKELLGTIYSALRCDWLGAAWFITALFAGILIQKAILILNGNKPGIIYYVLVMILFCMGYMWRKMGVCPVPINGFILYSIVQFYYGLGVVVSYIVKHVKVPGFYNKKKILCHVGILFVSVLLLVLWGDVLHKAMDIASLNINNPLIDVGLTLSGCLFLWNVSQLIACTNLTHLKRAMTFVGKNTMGILFFHFIGFKLVTLILAGAGVTDIGNVAMLVPPVEASNYFWPLYVVVAIIFSLGIWTLLKKVKIINFIIGADTKRYKRIYEKLMDNKFYRGATDVIEESITMLGVSYGQIWKCWIGEKKNLIWLALCVVVLLIGIL